MGNVLLEDLQREIEAGSVIAIIGVGVSVAATNNKSVASWRGLLHHGVDHCRELKSLTGVDEKWAKRVHEEIDSGDLDDMLSAAEKISRKLRRARWGRVYPLAAGDRPRAKSGAPRRSGSLARFEGRSSHHELRRTA